MNDVVLANVPKEPAGIGLTPDKKKLLKSIQGVATSPIDFNRIREMQKYNNQGN